MKQCHISILVIVLCASAEIKDEINSVSERHIVVRSGIPMSQLANYTRGARSIAF